MTAIAIGLEQVAYSYTDTAGNLVWYGTHTGVHIEHPNQPTQGDYVVRYVFETVESGERDG